MGIQKSLKCNFFKPTNFQFWKLKSITNYGVAWMEFSFYEFPAKNNICVNICNTVYVTRNLKETMHDLMSHNYPHCSWKKNAIPVLIRQPKIPKILKKELAGVFYLTFWTIWSQELFIWIVKISCNLHGKSQLYWLRQNLTSFWVA